MRCSFLPSLTLSLLLPPFTIFAQEGEILQLPEGGRLEALDDDGAVIGPCPLKHTDVDVTVAGHFTRVTLRQEYHNPYEEKIEAVYTFPMSHRSAVDQMRLIIGDRIIEGDVKERDEARMIYEAARDAGHVASLLEQERPNIFTQAVANIEPNANIIVEISYIETLEARDGEYSFEFPMVVGPRYIPGTSTVSPAPVPAELQLRHGVVLLGPAKPEVGEQGEVGLLGTLQPGKLSALLSAARPIKYPTDRFWGKDAGGNTKLPRHWYSFSATYADGSKELGQLYVDGTGHLNNRWFFTDPAVIKTLGTGFAQNTNQVPDASRITPMPTKPETRAGHDISINVRIDTGGPQLAELISDLHEIQIDGGGESRFGSSVALHLAQKNELPNRDFVLHWKLEREAIEEAILTHSSNENPKGKFLTLILNPPARVESKEIRPRELIFVMDTSGSMWGYPIEHSKQVMRKAINSMRELDTFNLITFAGNTQILWPSPREASEQNKREALAAIDRQQGGGGTEMMRAIDAALVQQDRGQNMRIVMFLTDGYVGNDMAIIDAIRRNADTTRVFSFGIGNSVNRYLIDGMAQAGRGESEFVLLESEAQDAVDRFTRRIQTPVLTDISLEFSEGLDVVDVTPGTDIGRIPDLFDAKPLVIHARYEKADFGTVTIRGRTATGPFERTILVELLETNDANDQLPALWARARIDSVTGDHLAEIQQGSLDPSIKAEIVNLGVTYKIMSQFTSFVAVEKSRITIGGRPMLIPVPIEMPHGVSYEGIFGEDGQAVRDADGGLVLGLQPTSVIEDWSVDGEIDATVLGGQPIERLSRRGRTSGSFTSAAASSARAGPRSTTGLMPPMMRSAPGGGGFGGGGGGFARSSGSAPPPPRPERRKSEATREGRRDFGTSGGFAPMVDADGSIADWIALTIERRGDTHPRDVLESIFGDADQRFFIERLVITINELVQHDQVKAALAIRNMLVAWRPEDPTVLALHAALPIQTGDVFEESQKEQVASVVDTLRATIEAFLEGPMREYKIRHRLDDALKPFAFGNGFPESLVQLYDGPVPQDSQWLDGGIIITVLFDPLSDSGIASLERLGLKMIDRVDASDFVVAVCPLGRFDDVALLEDVRRVDLVRD